MIKSADGPELLRVLPVPGGPANLDPPSLSEGEHERLYRAMLMIRLLDEKMMLMQRQGRIAFFGPSAGQEAAIAATGLVARDEDWIFPALREGGVLLMRGFPLERWFGQLFGNILDVQKGRQQPMHFSSRAHRFLSLSSVIGTQLPQAVGAAYAARLRGKKHAVFAYMGDGATSSADFHMAMNFAAVWKVPVVLICQNNHWAISVPFEKQTRSESIAIKAEAYGMPGVRVDGSDPLAVVHAARQARRRAAEGLGPTLLELVTWRRGGHSSSDDPTRYRDETKAEPWLLLDPMDRYRDWLVRENLWDDEREEASREELRLKMERALRESESAAQPPLGTLVEDVYADVPLHLRSQMGSVEGDGSGTAEGEFPL